MKYRKISLIHLIILSVYLIFTLFYSQVASTTYLNEKTNEIDGFFKSSYNTLSIIFAVLIFIFNLIVLYYSWIIFKTNKYYGIYESLSITLLKIFIFNVIISLLLFIVFVSVDNLVSNALISWIILFLSGYAWYYNLKFTYKLYVM
ncbi:MAG: hypothetical protein HRT99_01470 [Mycoplasmatales bacterium]|nr:hypothetical protein [Mycoplasmatales bacterium]